MVIRTDVIVTSNVIIADGANTGIDTGSKTLIHTSRDTDTTMISTPLISVAILAQATILAQGPRSRPPPAPAVTRTTAARRGRPAMGQQASCSGAGLFCKASENDRIPFLIRTGCLYGTGIENVNIMEHASVMALQHPLVICYPSTYSEGNIFFLSFKPASTYRCTLVK